MMMMMMMMMKVFISSQDKKYISYVTIFDVIKKFIYLSYYN